MADRKKEGRSMSRRNGDSVTTYRGRGGSGAAGRRSERSSSSGRGGSDTGSVREKGDAGSGHGRDDAKAGRRGAGTVSVREKDAAGYGHGRGDAKEGRGGAGTGPVREKDAAGSGNRRGDERAGRGGAGAGSARERDAAGSGHGQDNGGRGGVRSDEFRGGVGSGKGRATEQKFGQPLVNDIAIDLIRKHSSYRLKDCGNSSDSDTSSARFKTPVSKRRRIDVLPQIPKKGNKHVQEVTDEEDEGDQSHKRSEKLLRKKRIAEKEEDEEETDDEIDSVNDVKKLRKIISKLKQRMRGSLKYQTVKITASLDKKNKELMKRIEELEKSKVVEEVKPNEDEEREKEEHAIEMKGPRKEVISLKKKLEEVFEEVKPNEDEGMEKEEHAMEIKGLRKEVISLKKKLEKEISTSIRYRRERNEADREVKDLNKDVAKVVGERNTMKKEKGMLVDRVKVVREELKVQMTENSKLEQEIAEVKYSSNAIDGFKAANYDSEAAGDDREGADEKEAADEEEEAADEKEEAADEEEKAAIDVRVADDDSTVKVAAPEEEAVEEYEGRSGNLEKPPVRVVEEEQSKDLSDDGRERGGAGNAKEVIVIEETQDDGEAASKEKEVDAASKEKETADASKGKGDAPAGKRHRADEVKAAGKKQDDVSLPPLSKEDRLANASKKKEAFATALKKTGKDDKRTKTKDEFEEYVIDAFPSDDEISWESNQKFRVDKFIVTNSKDATESRSRTVRLPKKVIQASKLFKATSFNNQVMFIALNSNSVSTHDPKRGGNLCGLPYCSRKWVRGDPIAMVYVFDLPFNPKNESDQWVCQHHATASVSGYILQLQNAIKQVPKQPKPAAASGSTDAGEEVTVGVKTPVDEKKDPFDDLELMKGSFGKKDEKK